MLHTTLKDALDREFAAAMLEPAELCRDALLVRLRNEVTIELRMPDAREYSIGWRWGGPIRSRIPATSPWSMFAR
jgi:hypothetical protein